MEAGPPEGEAVAGGDAEAEAPGEGLWPPVPLEPLDGPPPHEAAIAASKRSVAALLGAET